MERLRISISGIVQGVGFRPFVYNLARRYNLAGWVLNDAAGVQLEAEGDAKLLTEFVNSLKAEAPPLASIERLEASGVPVKGDSGFTIRHSTDAAAGRVTLISPDVATCPDCRRELGDPQDRRYRYAFANCTNCGPRYTIITDVPYDRERTTMRDFTMCPSCQAEYDDPGNRRFHAQPNACPVCGPAYSLLDSNGTRVEGDPLTEAGRLLAGGAILAIKGLGGYHLACDAKNPAAVAKLRLRKIREDKPFAVMCRSIEDVRLNCLASPEEEELLSGTVRPIVLLAKGPEYALAAGVAPGNPYLGVMLPYAPVHWLLLAPGDAWVMTSGNTSDEPIAYDDQDALARLGSIADYFLVHNRPIYCRADDSVARVFARNPYILRRGRGMAPAPVRLAAAGPAVLACGGELKNTFCLTRDDLAFVSSHVGDLENMPTYDAYSRSIEHYKRLFGIQPELVAYDLHPEYLSTKYAKELALPQVGVQHHHAHIAAVLAEHDLNEPVIGVAFDGTGYGTDGRIWGGEFLLADCRDFTRLAHCDYLPLPGGAKAIREPWRPAAWVLNELYGPEFSNLAIPLAGMLPAGWELAIQAAAKGINAPLTSSAGRLFDIAAAVLGLRSHINYEGQAAVELELVAAGAEGFILPYRIEEAGLLRLDFRPVFAAMVERLAAGAARAELAAAFHTTLAAAVADIVRRLSKTSGVRKVALSGGVFQNFTLLRQVVAGLETDFTILLHRQVPPNDGGLALGQAIVARERGK